ncbi:response regulator transcription factor [Halomonas koreensis]|uniref:Response regulator transcription factor n=1 Tax=Halomonas koreensis TaxID=245385 RepID=A0ABU1FXS6_9GAMM|nr:response regulator transcription factor [Halomonas koreensis]MDR5865481.1 response regulator transcription factor [Halomonas koreensis]
MHTLMVADDHPLFREAIAAAIRAGLPGCRLLEAASLGDALARADDEEALDLVLLDLGLPDAEGLAGLSRLREACPTLPVVVVSAEQERTTILDAIALGAVGYIPKSTPRPDLIAALDQVLGGQVYLPPSIMRRAPGPHAAEPPNGRASVDSRLETLTDKQLQVLARMVRGDANKVIARELDIAETTVKTHVSAILRKLEVSSRVQAILAADQADLAAQLSRRQLRA